MVGVSFDVHLVPQVLEFSLKRIAWGELVCISVRRLYVLHVFFGFDLDYRRFSENHNLNNTGA